MTDNNKTPKGKPSAQRSITDFLDSPMPRWSHLKPLMTSTPAASLLPTAKRKRKYNVDKDQSQTVIDAGQRLIGTTVCNDCGMVYSVDVVRDRDAHDNFHNRFTTTKFFKADPRSLGAWKKKHYHEVVAGPVNGIVFKIEPNVVSSLKTKFANIVKEIVDVQLGICNDIPVFSEDYKECLGFAIVTDTTPNYIGAVVVAQRVNAAKLMPSGKAFVDNNPENGFIAVERLWVHPKLRRKGLATRLLDIVRRLYCHKVQLLRTRIAFSDQNKEGILLAQAYLNKNGQYVIYDNVFASRPQTPSWNNDTVTRKRSMSTTPSPAKKIKVENETKPKRQPLMAIQEENKDNDEENGKKLYNTLIIDEENEPLRLIKSP